MKLQRLLFVAVPAGLGLAWWAASWAASGNSPSPHRLETAGVWAESAGVQPKPFQPVVQVAAQVPLNAAPDPSLGMPCGPDLMPGEQSFLAPRVALAPPPASEPAKPLATGAAADDRLEFTVTDVPSAGPGDGVVRLPPLPDEVQYGTTAVQRLPPLPEKASPAAPPAREMMMIAGPTPSPQTNPPPIEVVNLELSAGSNGNKPTAAAAPEVGPPAGAVERDLPRSTVQPNHEDPAAASPVADLRPLAELLRDAGAPAVASQAPLPSSPRVGETAPPAATLPLNFPQLASPSETPEGTNRLAVTDAAKPSSLPSSPGPVAPASSPVTSSSTGASIPPPWATPTSSSTPSSSTSSSSSTNAASVSPTVSVASLSPALRQEKQEQRPPSTATVLRPAQPSGPAAQRAMHAVLLKADAHMQRGIALADRRAFYSARAEFLAALRLLAQGLDAQDGGTARSEALARGIWALDEANDFIPRGTAMNADLQIDRLVAAHRTTVLKSSLKSSSESSPASVTPLQAVQTYYTYSQEELATAIRPSREGSQLLTALGKLYVEMNQEPARLAADAKTKGLVCQQAALLADPNNARAANELGVLLAREGRFEEARDWLRHSARLKSQPETWHNLATVHAGLGETQLAAAARDQSVALARRQGPAVGGPPQVQVKQVSPVEFARQAGPGTSTPAASAPAAPQTAAKTKSSGLWSWLPWR